MWCWEENYVWYHHSGFNQNQGYSSTQKPYNDMTGTKVFFHSFFPFMEVFLFFSLFSSLSFYFYFAKDQKEKCLSFRTVSNPDWDCAFQHTNSNKTPFTVAYLECQ